GVWDGEWGDPARRNEINRIQLDLSDVITFHSYADPGGFEGRLEELTPIGRPMLCTEYMARTLDSTVETILPITRRRNVGAYTWGFFAGKTQTFLPWDSWDRPVTGPPGLWFHDLLNGDGSPYRDSEINTIRELTGRRGP
ncbi:MAG: 1,4-beta-xylanase, partial [Mycolicibacterium sp.]